MLDRLRNRLYYSITLQPLRNEANMANMAGVKSFAFIWLIEGNQFEFCKHPDGGLEPPTSKLPVHCSTNWADPTNFRMLLTAYMNIACFIVVMLWFNYDVIYVARYIKV